MSKIHFLNVGHGDCAIIEHNNGNLSVIDINNGASMDDESFDSIVGQLAPNKYLPLMVNRALGADERTILNEAGYSIELTNPVQFLQNEYPAKPIFRYIQTHPDLDHMRGLVGLREANIPILNFWDTVHTKALDPDETSEEDMAEWNEYQRLRSGKVCTVLHLTRGSQGVYYNQDPAGVLGGNGLHILSPTPELLRDYDEDGKRNELSYVIKYCCANRVVIFGGDAEQAAWQSVYDAYGDSLKCDVLKASHHGRDSGYHQEAVKAMSPTYTIVSVGKKPECDASNKYRQYSDNVWSTRWFGTMTLEITNDGAMSWTAEEVANEA